jgi:hypothetical protein
MASVRPRLMSSDTRSHSRAASSAAFLLASLASMLPVAEAMRRRSSTSCSSLAMYSSLTPLSRALARVSSARMRAMSARGLAEAPLVLLFELLGFLVEAAEVYQWLK